MEEVQEVKEKLKTVEEVKKEFQEKYSSELDKILLGENVKEISDFTKVMMLKDLDSYSSFLISISRMFKRNLKHLLDGKDLEESDKNFIYSQLDELEMDFVDLPIYAKILNIDLDSIEGFKEYYTLKDSLLNLNGSKLIAVI